MKVETVKDSDFQAKVLDRPGTTLVVFTAKWCGPCRIVASYAQDLVARLELQDIKVMRADVEETTQVSQEYCVPGTPTFKLFTDGRVVMTAVGALRQVQDVENWVKEVMEERRQLTEASRPKVVQPDPPRPSIFEMAEGHIPKRGYRRLRK